MINTISFSKNTLQNIAAEINKKDQINKLTAPRSSNQFIPSMTGQLKYAPSKKFIHVKTTKNEDGTEIQTYLNSVYIHIANLDYIINNIILNEFATVEAFQNDVIDQFSGNLFSEILLFPLFSDDDDDDVITYVNVENSQAKYTNGDRIYWNKNQAHITDECKTSMNTDWIELPIPAPTSDEVIEIYISLVNNFDEFILSENGIDEILHKIVISGNKLSHYDGLKSVKDMLGFVGYSPFLTFNPIQTTVLVDNNGNLQHIPSGNNLSYQTIYQIKSTNTVPMIRVKNPDFDVFQCAACMIASVKRLNDKWFYQEFYNALGNYRLIHISPEDDGKCITKTMTTNMGWGYQISKNEHAAGLNKDMYIQAWFFSYISKELHLPIYIMMTSPHPGDYNDLEEPPAEAMESIYQIFGQKVGTLQKITSKTQPTIGISFNNNSVYDTNYVFPIQVNLNVADIVESLINIPQVDTLYSSLSSINWNERSGIGDLQIFKFNDPNYHIENGSYNTNPYEFVIRDNSGNPKVNYLTLSALAEDLLSGDYGFDSSKVDTKDIVTQKSIDKNDDGVLQIYNFDKNQTTTLPTVLNAINNSNAKAGSMVKGWNNSSKQVEYVNLQGPDSLKPNTGSKSLEIASPNGNAGAGFDGWSIYGFDDSSASEIDVKTLFNNASSSGSNWQNNHFMVRVVNGATKEVSYKRLNFDSLFQWLNSLQDRYNSLINYLNQVSNQEIWQDGSGRASFDSFKYDTTYP